MKPIERLPRSSKGNLDSTHPDRAALNHTGAGSRQLSAPFISRKNKRLKSLVPTTRWQEQRMRIAARICREIAKKNRPVTRSFRYFARLYRDRCYDGTEQPIRLARGTIACLYYRWLKAGRDDNALRLKLQNGAALTTETAMRLVKASLTPYVYNFWLAYKLIPNPRRSLGCSRDAIPVRLHREIDRLFRSRRAVWRCEIRVLRLLRESEAGR